MSDVYEPTEYESVEAAKKELDKKREKYYDELTLAFKSIADSRQGRLVLCEIIKWCGLFNAVTPKEDSVLHAEGRRLVGIQLKDRLDQINVEIFHDMMQEGVRYEKAIFED